jgi:hypothetical protein
MWTSLPLGLVGGICYGTGQDLTWLSPNRSFVDYSATSAQHRTMCPVCTRSTLTPEPNSSKLRLLVTVRNEGGTTIEYNLGEALDEDLVWQQQEEDGAAYEAFLAAEAEKRKVEEVDIGHNAELGAKLAVLCQKHEWKAALELISELREEEDRDQREIVDFLVDETKVDMKSEVDMKEGGECGVGWSRKRSGLHLAVLAGDMEWVMFCECISTSFLLYEAWSLWEVKYSPLTNSIVQWGEPDAKGRRWQNPYRMGRGARAS